MVGKTLGHYEVLDSLGAGGMGEVYRARDKKLERDVAIKVLPDDLAADPDRLARFEREAKLLASLSHANIGAIHGLEESDGVRFLVLELIEGESLERRLQRGPAPVPEALDIARQIAEALEAAHEAGIIHRDVKPANVLLTAKGGVKVLDFGIAKSTLLDGAARAALTEQATLLTIDGTLTGTPPYMAPERIRGEEADKRVDIWAFGCVVCEMLTGKPAFARETVADTLVAVLESDPDWAALPPTTPNEITALLHKCVRKDSHRRLRDIGDARIEIEETLTSGPEVRSKPAATRTGEPTVGAPLWRYAVLAVASALVGMLAFWFALPWSASPVSFLSPPTGGMFAVDYPTGSVFRRRNTRGIAVSPDGGSIVFSAGGRLWRRSMGDLSPVEIRDTGGARTPVFSSDGRRLAFWQGGEFRSVSTDGDSARVPLGPAEQPFGATWAEDGYIYYGQGAEGIWRIADDGSQEPEHVFEVADGEKAHGPSLLPGGEWLLFTVADGDDWNEARIVVQSRLTKERKELNIRGTDARYLPTEHAIGHVVYVRRGDLFAVPFDAARREPTGRETSALGAKVQPSAADLNNASRPTTGTHQFAFGGKAGNLAYIPAGAISVPNTRLVLRNRADGSVIRLPFPARKYQFPRLSPDGTQVVVAVWDDVDDDADIWIYPLDGEDGFRLTDEGRNLYPAWSHDGESVYFESDRGGRRDVWQRRVDRSADARLVAELEGRQSVYDVSNDGKRLLVGDPYQNTPVADISILTLGDPATLVPMVSGPENNMFATFSQDGRSLAYWTVQDGTPTVNVREASGGIRPLGSGRFPVWSRDGAEIFFWDGPEERAEMYVVSVEPSGGDGYSRPAPLFAFEPSELFHSTFDVTADGQRFLMLEPAPPDRSQLVVVLNWGEELKRSVPVGR